MSDPQAQNGVPRTHKISVYYKNFESFETPGQQYKAKTASLLYLRGLRDTVRDTPDGDDFHLATNADGAGALDDIIFKFKPRNQAEYKTCCMQIQHKESNTLSRKELLDNSYFYAYLEIEKRTRNQNVFLFDNLLENCEFVLYTDGESERLPKDTDLKKDEQYDVGVKEMLGSGGKNECVFRFTLESVKHHFSWISDFLDKLTVLTGQATGKLLNRLLEKELAKLTETKTLTKKTLFKQMELWWARCSEELNKSSSDTWKKAGEAKSNGDAKISERDRERVNVCAFLFLRAMNSKETFTMRRAAADSECFGHVVYKYKLRGEDKTHTCYVQLRTEDSDEECFRNEFDFVHDPMEVAYRKTLEQKEKGEDCEFVVYSSSNAEADTWQFQLNDNVPAAHKELFASNTEGDAVFQMNGQRIKERVTSFYSRVSYFTKQATEEGLTAAIEDALVADAAGKTANFSKLALANLRVSFVNRMGAWWSSVIKGDALTKSSHLWWDVCLNSPLRDVLKSLKISYTTDETQAFWAQLEDKRAIHVQTPDVIYEQMTCLKLLESLERHRNERFLFVQSQVLLKRKAEIRTALTSVWCEVLVVDCTEIDDMADAVAAELRRVAQDRKVIVVSRVDQKLSQFVSDGFQVVDDTFDFYTLDANSQNHLMSRKVVFKGSNEEPITVEEILKGEEHLRELKQGSPGFDVKEFASTYLRPYDDVLVVGPSLASEIPEFISRSVAVSSSVKVDALTEDRADVFIVSKINVETLRGLLSREAEDAEVVAISAYVKGSGHVSHVYTANEKEVDECIAELSKTNSNIHWLSYDSFSKTFHWKRSTGSLVNLRNFIDKNESVESDSDTLLRSKAKVVLVTAEPGSGKTTLVTHTALQLRETHPASWIVRVNLDEHTQLLDKFGCKGCATEYEFLAFALTKDVGPSLQRQLLNLRLRQHGNVVVLLDGFGDVAGYYKEQVSRVLEFMIRSKQPQQVWVTARQAFRTELEDLLGTIAFTLKEIGDEEQRDILDKLWKGSNVPHARRNGVIELISESFSHVHNDVIGTPLQVKMLAEAYGSNGKEPPSRIGLLELCELFVGKRWEGFLAKYRGTQGDREQYAGLHAMAALMYLWDDRDLATLHDKDIGKKVTEFFQRVIERQGGTGIVNKIEDDRPVFCHRVVAEYFAACWLAKNFADNREFLMKMMFQADFQLTRHLLDRLLSRGLPLHEAVMDHDMEVIKNALLHMNAPAPSEPGARTPLYLTVNAGDAGGRTPLHLAVLHMGVPTLWPSVIADYRLAHVLIASGADLQIKDKVLGLEAPGYAVRLGRAATANLLTVATNARIPAYVDTAWVETLSTYINVNTHVLDRLEVDAASYKLKLCALIYLRCVKRSLPFFIGANVAGAESFGDIVIKCKKNKLMRTYFLQVFQGHDKRFVLEQNVVKKLAADHAKIMQSVVETSRSVFFSGPSENCEMLGFTNERYVEDIKGERNIVWQPVEHDFMLTNKQERSYKIQDNDKFTSAFTMKYLESNEVDVEEMVKKELRMCAGVEENNLMETMEKLTSALRMWWLWSDELLTEDSVLLKNALPVQDVILQNGDATPVAAKRKRSKMMDFDTLKYPKCEDFNNTVGNHWYKVKLLTMLYLRNRPDCYFLAPHIIDGPEGQLPDVAILRYKAYPNDPFHKSCFVYFFNKQSVESPVVLKDFLHDGRFSVGWYLKKYGKEMLKTHQLSVEGEQNILGDFNDWRFVAFTNCPASKELMSQPRGPASDVVAQSLSLGAPESLLTVKFTKESFPDLYMELVLMAMIPAVARGGDPSKWTDEFFDRFTLILGQSEVDAVDNCVDADIASILSRDADIASILSCDA